MLGLDPEETVHPAVEHVVLVAAHLDQSEPVTRSRDQLSTNESSPWRRARSPGGPGGGGAAARPCPRPRRCSGSSWCWCWGWRTSPRNMYVNCDCEIWSWAKLSQIKNIPYGQSSAKLPVIPSSSHLVIWLSGHLVICSSGYPVIRLSGHSGHPGHLGHHFIKVTKSPFLCFQHCD